MSIKTKLTLSIIAVFLLMVVIIGSVFFSAMKATLASEVMFDAGQLCHDTAYSLEKHMLSDAQVLRAIAAHSQSSGAYILDEISEIKDAVRISGYEYIALQWNDEWYSITSEDYKSIPPPNGISHEIYSAMFFGYLYDGENEGVLVAEPIMINGEQGMLVAKRPVSWLETVIASEYSDTQANVIISKPDGQIIYPKDIGLTVSAISGPYLQNTILINGFEQREYNGVSVEIKNVGLNVTAYVNPDSVDQQMDKYVLYYVLFALGGLIFISVIVYAVSYLQTRSIVELARFTERYEITGERIPHKFTRRQDEAGVLSRSFASIMNRLSSSMGKMRHMAYHDNLTKLKNRYSMESDIEILISNKEKFAFSLMDIDDFKIINDMMGHAEGDRLLVCIARIFESLVSDTLDVYRWGGDEFAFILTGGDKQSYKADIEKVLGEVAIRFDSSNKWRISVSAGICMYPESASSYAELLVLADQALILSKRSGKARYKFYEDI